jgi:hypothetical protein
MRTDFALVSIDFGMSSGPRFNAGAAAPRPSLSGSVIRGYFSEKMFAVWVLEYIFAFVFGIAFKYFTIAQTLIALTPSTAEYACNLELSCPLEARTN